MPDKKTLWVITSEPDTGASSRGAPHAGGGSGIRAVEVDRLQANLQAFLGALEEMLAASVSHSGEFRLEEVDVSAEIAADGSILVLGTGARTGSPGGLRFVLKRASAA